MPCPEGVAAESRHRLCRSNIAGCACIFIHRSGQAGGTQGGDDLEKIEGSAALTAVHYQVLRESQRRIGLDYFGVDCGLDRSGNLVMFEANASMLVHDQNERKFATDSRGN